MQPVALEDAGRLPIPGFRPVWRRQELQFTILHMVASRPVRVTWPLVSRALHTTRIGSDELLIQR